MEIALIDVWDAQMKNWAAGLGWPMEGMFRLVLAAMAGGLVGLEREIRGREAGFRTNMLVCLGSALVMVVSIQFAYHPWAHESNFNITVDPSRIAYGVMTGVGFLGAGTIIHTRESIRGLTTAAGLWCVAAVGLAVGFGLYMLSAMATVLIFLALWFMEFVQGALPKQQYREMTVRTVYRPGCVRETVQRFKEAGIKVVDTGFSRTPDLHYADVHLRISYFSTERYNKLEHELQGDAKFNIIESHEP